MSTAQQEYIDAGAFTINKLKDYRQSYVEVMNLKHAVRDEILNQWLPGIVGVPHTVVQQIQERLADFDAVATKCKLRVADFLDYDSIRGRMVECVDLVKSERQAASADGPGGQTATGNATGTGAANAGATGTSATGDDATEKGIFQPPSA